MIDIIPNQVTPAFVSLFDRSMPTAARCYAVLGGGNAGMIFTDELENPRLEYLWERDDGILYQGGVRDWQVLH